MNAVFFDQHGPSSVLQYGTLPDPVPSENEVLVRIHATSVNHVDTLVRGGYPGLVVPFPHIPGGDVAGTVEQVGSKVKDFKVGDRIVSWPLIACHNCEQCARGKEYICFNWQFIGMHRHGSYAEKVVLPADSLIHLPDSVTFEQAASLPTAGIVPMHGFDGVGHLQPGETFFMWGGASGLGTFAIQIAKHIGATVIATAGTKEKIDVMKKLGADHVFNHYEDDVQAEVLKLTQGRGVDLIIDFVGPLTFPKSFAMLKKGGRMMLCGIITGREVTLPMHLTYLHHKSILGLYLGEKKDLQNLVDLVAKNIVTPVIFETLPLSRAAEAQDLLKAGKHYGKILMKP
jgi:NADPH2:quinone reductase